MAQPFELIWQSSAPDVTVIGRSWVGLAVGTDVDGDSVGEAVGAVGAPVGGEVGGVGAPVGVADEGASVSSTFKHIVQPKPVVLPEFCPGARKVMFRNLSM